MSLRACVFLVAVASLAAACGGSPKAGSLMNQTTAGQNRCTVAKSHDRPFVVEWDATDLASFEVLARRDVVFVKYGGCELSVLDQCADESIEGAYGKYAAPQFSQGTVDQIDINDEGELYAQLPLGAAALSGKVESGQALHLRYFVSGVATATRASFYRKDIANNPKCGGATHFVAAYNVGAFEISSSERDKESAKIGIGQVGGGGSRSHEATAIKHGGDLATCVQNDLSACKVPIRLVLRPIDEGERPSAAAAASVTAPQGETADTRSGRAATLHSSAYEKGRAGDAGACLVDLDQAEALGEPLDHYLRALCTVRLGKCDEAKKQYRLALKEREKDKTDQQLGAMVDEWASRYAGCKGSATSQPQSQSANDLLDARDAACKKDAASAPCRAMKGAVAVRDAAEKKDFATCASSAKDVLKDYAALGREQPYTYLSLRAIKAGGQCAGDAGSCADARTLFQSWGELANPGAPRQQKEYLDTAYGAIAACAGK